jgi:hypothetical protein
MRILFICRDIYYFDYPLIAEVLSRSYGMETYAVTFSTKTFNIILNKNPNSFKEIYNLDNFFYSHGDFRETSLKNKIKYLESLEFTLKIPSLYLLIYSDRTIVRNKYDDLLTIAYGTGKFVESVLEKGFDVVIGEIGTFLDYLFLKYSSLQNFFHLSPFTARFKGRIAFVVGEKGEVCGMKKNLEIYKNSEINEEDEKAFNDFYQDFLKGRKKPECTEKINFFSKSENIISAYKERANVQNKSRYVLESIDSSSLRELIYLRIKKEYMKSLIKLKGIFRPVGTNKFIYFPLHVDPEIATLTYSPFYVNQLAVIENIAKSIPVGYTLAVKDHPYMYGLRDASYYEKIARFPNIIIFHPLEDNYNIIQNAEAVIVLTGTVGLETILMEKPLFILGNVFYDTYDLAYKVDNIKDLPMEIKHHIHNFRRNPNILKKFILAYMKSTFDGIIDNPLERREFLSDTNMTNIANAIFQVCTVEFR